MASQQSDLTGALPSAQVVGNVFVQQFFHILHRSPELVHRFYQESSWLGRPGVKGEMSTVSTLQAIDEKIISMDYNEYRAQIKTVDAQESLGGGVIVLVTGYLIGKDNVKKDFTQTFFLATQDNGYYVLNDIFRYVEDPDQQQQEEHEFNYEADTSVVTEHEPLHTHEENVPEQTSVAPEENEVNVDEIYNPSEHEDGSAVEDEDPVEEVINEVLVEEASNELPIEEVINQVPVKEVVNEVRTVSAAVVTDAGLSTRQENKKSYASIVKVMKENITPVSVPTLAPTRMSAANIERQVKVMKENITPASVPTSTSARVASVNLERQVTSAQVLPSASEITTAGSNVAENSNVQDSEADSYSIYIKNLPLSATAAQLEEEFKKFGPIKPNGIQVRSNKLQGFCFGFVEFEAVGALQSAIEASPIMIGNRQAYVEEKRTTGSRVNNRGRFQPGRGGGFRGDGMRNRGTYGGGGRSYGRGDYNYRSDYGNRGGGRSWGQGDMGYQRVDHMSSNYERRSRPGSPSSQNGVAPRVQASA